MPPSDLPPAGRAASLSCLLVLNAAEGFLQFILAGLAEAPAQGDVNAGNSGAAESAPPQEISPLTATLLCFQSWNAPSQGAELVTPALANALERLNLRPRNITRIACVTGPGSFTGLRLTSVTSAGVARACGALQAGMEYLPLLAAQAVERLPDDFPSESFSTPAAPKASAASLCSSSPSSCSSSDDASFPAAVFWVTTHARRNLIHLQGFIRSQAAPLGVRSASKVHVVSLPDAATLIGKHGGRPFLLGSGCTRNRAFWEQALPSLPSGARLLSSCFDAPDEFTLLRAASLLVYGKNDCSPLYVRGSDAEENLEQISKSLNNDPQEARRLLEELTGKVI